MPKLYEQVGASELRLKCNELCNVLNGMMEEALDARDVYAIMFIRKEMERIEILPQRFKRRFTYD